MSYASRQTHRLSVCVSVRTRNSKTVAPIDLIKNKYENGGKICQGHYVSLKMIQQME